MTFSIVAADRKRGEIGFAIASCCWDAGQVCMARANVGAIASQAQGNLAFLPQFFDQLSSGHDPDAILKSFEADDPDFDRRQIGLITPDGPGRSHTGSRCASWAGHRTGPDFACQGNILVGPQVVDSMVEAFVAKEGRLHERLLAALVAGDDVGGDRRGKQSARLLVAREGAGQPGTDTFLDLRVEDHDEPVREISRTFGVGRTLMMILGLLGEASEAEGAEKVPILDRLRDLLEDRRQPRYLDWWESLASAYEGAGETDKSVEAYLQYVSINPGMEPVLREGARRGDISPEIARRILSNAT